MPTIPGTREDDLLLMDERIEWLEERLHRAKGEVAKLQDHLKNMRQNRALVAKMDGYDD